MRAKRAYELIPALTDVRAAVCAIAVMLLVAGAVFVPVALAVTARTSVATDDLATQTVRRTVSAPATPTITSPVTGSKTKYYSTTVKVEIASDTTRVALLRGGTEVTSAVTSGETSVTFAAVSLHLGYNALAAVAANEAGQATSTAISVKVVGRVGRPKLYGFFSGRVYYGPRPNVAARTGANTTRIVLFVNGRRIRRLSIGGGRSFTLRSLPLRYGVNKVTVYGLNEFYAQRVYAAVWRLDIRPRFLSLVLVDKSERRIYLIKRRKLIARYPCAIGKPSTPTPERVWRIDSKEYPAPSSVYGPRKMRLFARHRSRRGYWYEYTNYAIHGTDTPSSIGHMASHGCIRMFNRHILRLFPRVPLHTMVVTRR